VLSVLIVSALLAPAASARWEATNPGGGGAFNSPIVLPNGTLAVGSDLGGVYISRNGGLDWIAIGATYGIDVTHVSSMAAHPSDTILVGTEEGIFKIDPTARTIDRTYVGGYVSAIVVSANPNRVYAAVHPNFEALDPFIIVSTDAGESWSATGSNLPTNLRAVGMRAHPVDPLGVWFVSGEGRFATGPSQALFSVDGGINWLRLDPNEGAVVDVHYAYDDLNLNRMYLTTERAGQGVFFTSEDTGFSWTEVNPDVPGNTLPTGILLPDPSAPDHIRLIDFNYRSFTNETLFWESFDGGASWSQRSNDLIGGWSGADETWGMGSSFQGLLQTVGYNPVNPNTVLWVNTQFVYRSTDGGNTWRDTVSRAVGDGWSSRKVDNVVPIAIVSSSADPDLLYAGYMDMGMWRSDDGGDSWKDLNTVQYSGNWLGLGGNTLTVQPDPTRADVVWGQAVGDMEDPSQPYHLLKSTDRGESWTELTSGLPNPILRMESLALAEDSAPNNRWLFVVANGDVYLSQNDGTNWGVALNCGDCNKVWYTESGVFASGPSGVWRSWQGGVFGTWDPVALPAEITSGWTPGQHWLHDNWTYSGPIDLAVRDNEHWLAVLGFGKGLYYSDDFGVSWTKVRDDDYARSVELDPVTGEVFFGSSSAMQAGGYSPASAGLLKSPTGIGGWQSENQGLAFSMVTNVQISNLGERWIISPGQGVLRWVP